MSATNKFIVSRVTPDLIKYAWQCANEREHASVQKLSCADVRGLLMERDNLIEALKMSEKLVAMARKHFPASMLNSDKFHLEQTSAAIGKTNLK